MARTSDAHGTAAPIRREGRALGSPLLLVVSPGANLPLVERAWKEVVRVFAAVDGAMSRFREDSEITRLHRTRGPLTGLSRHLVAGLSVAHRAHRMTAGRFDARVVIDLERLGFVGVRQAWAAEPDDRCGEPFMHRAGRRGGMTLVAPVDLGGIGKGLALRWARRAAGAALGGAGFLLDAGGDIATRGSCDGTPWSVGLEDPLGSVEPLAVCVLDPDQAIATSSIRNGRALGPGGSPVHHLIDPRTGEPGGAGLSAVTVAWADPAWAEVWTKSLFLEGAAGIATAARRRGFAAWWVDANGVLSMTPAARQQTSWVRAEALRAG